MAQAILLPATNVSKKAIGRFSHSSSFQVAALFTFLLTIGVCCVAYFLHLSTNDIFFKESRIAVEGEIKYLKSLYAYGDTSAIQAYLSGRPTVEEQQFFYAVINKNELLKESDFTVWPLNQDGAKNGTAHSTQHYPTGSFDHALNAPSAAHLAHVAQLDAGVKVLVARSVKDLSIAKTIARSLGWSMIATMVLISGVSIWVGYYVVDRINRIADTTNRIIEQGAFDERLPIESSWDDLSQLSAALNTALDELAHKVQSIKSVSDNIAHDLRTPLTRLRADIESLDDDIQRSTLLKEVDNILAIFRGLLRIAEVEADKQVSEFLPHQITEILNDVIDLYKPLAEEKQIHIQTTLRDVSITCDRDLLFQALANVLDNAIKFTPKDGSITITLHEHLHYAVIRICDSGPGISGEDVEKVTQRFYRAEKSRHTPGNGLGLAMVNAVVTRHRGTLSFSQNPHNSNSVGVCCTLELPIEQTF